PRFWAGSLQCCPGDGDRNPVREPQNGHSLFNSNPSGLRRLRRALRGSPLDPSRRQLRRTGRRAWRRRWWKSRRRWWKSRRRRWKSRRRWWESREQLSHGKPKKRRVPRWQPPRGVGLLPVRLGMGLGPLLLLVVVGRPECLRRDG